jgi:hypothetical protein
VAALIPLARRLSGYSKLRGNFGPADPAVDRAVDECVKLCLGLVPLNSNTLNSLQDLCRRPLSRPLACCARGSRLMSDEISYDARVYGTEVYRGREVTTYLVGGRSAASSGERASGPPPRRPTAFGARC